MRPHTPAPENEELEMQPVIPRSLRYATVFDAVAGRITTVSLRDRPSASKPPKFRDVRHKQLPAVSPQLHLSGQRHALELAPEYNNYRRLNTYAAHRDLYPSDANANRTTELPDSALLRDVHAYTADFYGALKSKGVTEYTKGKAHQTGARPIMQQSIDLRSMDETALLAFGFLLEELVDVYLSHTGELAFVEDGVEALNNDHGIRRNVVIGQRVGSSTSRSQSRQSSTNNDSAPACRSRSMKRKANSRSKPKRASRKPSNDPSLTDIAREQKEARSHSTTKSRQRSEPVGSWGGKREGSGRPQGTKRKRIEVDE